MFYLLFCADIAVALYAYVSIAVLEEKTCLILEDLFSKGR